MPRLSSHGWLPSANPAAYSVLQHTRMTTQLTGAGWDSRVIAGTSVSALFAPPVVDDDISSAWRVVVEPCEELLRAPGGGRQLPLSIRENERWRISLHHVFQLRQHMPSDIISNRVLLIRAPQGMKPLVQTVINSKFQTPRAYSVSDFPNQISLGADIRCVPVAAVGAAGVSTGPKSKSVVVFRRRHNVLCAAAVENISPLCRVEQLSPEALCRKKRKNRRIKKEECWRRPTRWEAQGGVPAMSM